MSISLGHDRLARTRPCVARAKYAPDRVDYEQWLVMRPLAASFPNGYRVESVPDLVGNHSTVARQNGWPGGDKERMEHGAGCMEYKDGD